SPSRVLMVATSIWSEPFFSKSASFCVSAASLAGSIMSALSTTRPVSFGKSAASTGSALKVKAAHARRSIRANVSDWRNPMRQPIFPLVGEMSGSTEGGATSAASIMRGTNEASTLLAEIDLRHFQLVLRRGELLERLVAGEPEGRPQHGRKRFQRKIVGPH